MINRVPTQPTIFILSPDGEGSFIPGACNKMFHLAQLDKLFFCPSELGGGGILIKGLKKPDFSDCALAQSGLFEPNDKNPSSLPVISVHLFEKCTSCEPEV